MSRLCLWACACLLASHVGVLALREGEEGEQGEQMKSSPLRTHSLQAPYLDSDMQSRWWDFGGDTIVRADQYIRLTSDRPSQASWLFSRVPLTATNWQIEAEFKIGGTGSLYGDGLAIWLTKQRGQQGDVFGSVDSFEGLGIFIDTYKNNRPGVVFPYVMAMLGDGQTTYDKATDGKPNELAGCSARGIRNQNIPTKIRLTYIQDKSLSVDLQYKAEDVWTPCFDVADVKIPPVSYLGFSAETGELSDNHDIIRVETKNLYNPAPSPGDARGGAAQHASSRQRPKGHDASRGQGGGWAWFFLKFVLAGLGITAAYVAFTLYRANRRASRF